MLVFEALWGHCDKEGRFKWNPRVLKRDILPFLGFDLGASLVLLREAGMVKQYEIDGELYGEVPSFKDHQRIGGKEAQAPAKYPEPKEYLPSASPGNSGEAPGKHRGLQEGKGRERKGKEGSVSSLRSETGADGAANDSQQDPVKELFDVGVRLITATGKSEQQARSLVGKWRKAVGDERLAGILPKAASATEPVAWIEAAIRSRNSADDDRPINPDTGLPIRTLEKIRAESEAEERELRAQGVKI